MKFIDCCFLVACTSSAIQISYWNKNYYQVEVIFMEKHEWLQEQACQNYYNFN